MFRSGWEKPKSKTHTCENVVLVQIEEFIYTIFVEVTHQRERESKLRGIWLNLLGANNIASFIVVFVVVCVYVFYVYYIYRHCGYLIV